MHPLRALIGPAGRSLARHLGRLCRALGGLLRCIRDAAREALEVQRKAAPPRRGGGGAYRPGFPSRDDENLPPARQEPERGAGPRWARALAAVLGAAARWLLRPHGRYLGPLTAAASAAAALFGGLPARNRSPR
jgi:hypothetical protein